MTTSFLSLKPKVWTDSDRLSGRTHLLVQFMTLLSFCRTVHVDRHLRTVDVTSRRCWVLISHRQYSFDEISHIDYSHDATDTSWGWTMQGYDAHDSVDWFKVSLVLKDDDTPVKLFTFVGEGSVGTGMGGVIFGGDSMFDYEGAQERESLGYVDLLQAYTGLKLGRPLSVTHIPDAQGRKRVCVSCGRPNPPSKPKCQYCGGEITTE